MKRKNIIQLIGQHKSSAGFTLIELLVASIIGVIIIGAAGFGLSQVLKASKDGNAAADRRAEVARAYDFISDEIRRAELIEEDATNATGYTIDPDEDVVLALKIPNVDNDADNNTEARILYYVSDPPANSVWKGPKVLYRWGPPLDGNGEYTTGTWRGQPLIDEIDGSTVTPTCETGWTASSAAGFAACISPNNKTAQLYIEGDIKKALGQSDTYSANTKTFARSNQAADINSLDLPDISPSLGGEFNCNGSGHCPIDTQVTIYNKNDKETTKIKEGGSTKKPIPADRRIQVTSSTKVTCSAASSCIPVSIDFMINKDTGKVDLITDAPVDTSDDHKVKLYHNRSKVSNDTTKVFPGQKTPYQFLKDKGVEFVETSPDLTEYTIKMNPNQVMFAFEIGQNSSTLPNGDINPGYDHQDNLVVISSKHLNYPDP